MPAAGDVDVFADFYRALRAEDDEPSVAPGGQAVGRVPVHPDVAGAPGRGSGISPKSEIRVVRLP